ncbi:hypothetical protein Pmani_025872 [Petrolisthes manimaculis]|uniref:Uncharacterized protein n=1 Tax=Petrolisthes manimaculis TaxID=1843537 RepID=A0AAE1P738_9EUCA|nr:hypothetical protein Pmani_025872 [Petrolisthes manimaculis]
MEEEDLTEGSSEGQVKEEDLTDGRARERRDKRGTGRLTGWLSNQDQPQPRTSVLASTNFITFSASPDETLPNSQELSVAYVLKLV